MKNRLLFVCLGNICRSPAAEAIVAKMADEKGLNLEVDSAGTSAWHAGERADRRMRLTARERGYNITSISRPFIPSDFEEFDMIIAMDDQNYFHLREQARTQQEVEKIFRMREFFKDQSFDHVPDPYYGGADGFNQVIDLLEGASVNLIDHLSKQEG